MKRVVHRLLDLDDSLQVQVVLPEGEPFVPEPWMRHKIEREGWRVVEKEIAGPGLSAHGWADWRGVADNLATVVRALLDDQQDLSEGEAEQLLESAQGALDDYDTAVMEVSLAEDGPDEEGEGDGE